MATYYAYSEIRYDGGVIKFGEKVDQSTIGATDEEWESYIQDQVVGEEPVPEDLASTDTLSQYKVREAMANMEAAQAGEVSRPTAKATKADESTSSKS
jgi:hypothetical protein